MEPSNHRSDSIRNLAIALSNLQGEVTDAHKDKSGYGYTYADLAGVLNITRPLCLKHGFSVSQLCTSDNGQVGITTILMHSSGEFLESTLMMPINSVKSANAAQAAGSIITYVRRYALAAILGITQIENDANNETPDSPKSSDNFKKQKPTFNNFKKQEPKQQQQNLYGIVVNRIKSTGTTGETVRKWISAYNCKSLSQLNESQLKEILELTKEKVQ